MWSALQVSFKTMLNIFLASIFHVTTEAPFTERSARTRGYHSHIFRGGKGMQFCSETTDIIVCRHCNINIYLIIINILTTGNNSQFIIF